MAETYGAENGFAETRAAENVHVAELLSMPLIDRTPARFKMFNVLRGLLQNSDDAHAKKAFIRFESEFYNEGISVCSPKGPDMSKHVHQWTILNNGNWKQFQNIPDGTLDGEAISEFGVEFSNIFSVTDHLSVKSGGKLVQFNRSADHNNVNIRNVPNPGSASKKWTSFELPVRTRSRVPAKLADIARFLATSLQFMAHIESITVAFDSYTILRIKKEVKSVVVVPLLRDLQARRATGHMTVVAVDKAEILIQAEGWDYESNNGASISSGVSCSHFVWSSEITTWGADAEVTVDEISELGQGLLRIMKNPIPKISRFQLIYGLDNTASEESKEISWILEKPDLSRQSESFVHIGGHATVHTTGIAGPISAQFIATATRDSIDFSTDHAKIWNEELLYVGGYLTRTIYEFEMFEKERRNVHARALHALRYFSFHESSPYTGLSTTMRKAFFECSSSSPRILSSVGVRFAHDVRDFDKTCASFMKRIPMLESSVSTHVTTIVDILREKAILKPVGFSDIMLELKSDRILTELEMASCLEWVGTIASQWRLKSDRLNSFLVAARFFHSVSGQIISLSEITTYVDHLLIPSDSILPYHTLPFAISRIVPLEILAKVFSWKQLSVAQWLTHTLTTTYTTYTSITEIQFTKWVFGVLSDTTTWNSISLKEREKIRDILRNIPCIPTTKGLKRPGEVYLLDDILRGFLDLSMIDFTKLSIKGPSRDILIFLGVKVRVELTVLLEAAERHTEAMQYLLNEFEYYREEYERTEYKEKYSKKTYTVITFDGTRRTVTLSEVFSSETRQTSEFWIIDKRFSELAIKLGVSKESHTTKLLVILKNSPPRTIADAKIYLEYLYRVEFTREQLLQLSTLAFIPIFKDGIFVRFVEPANCYIGKHLNNLHLHLFTFVDFSEPANSFLKKCMAKGSSEVRVHEIATALIREPQRCLSIIGDIYRYYDELHHIHSKWSTISQEIMEAFRHTPALVGLPYKSYGVTRIDKTVEFAESLLLPSQVVIVDDEDLYYLFKDVKGLYHAPKHLESFYLSLGCQYVSKLVSEEDFDTTDEIAGHENSIKIRNLILERLPWFTRDLNNIQLNQKLTWLNREGAFQVKVFKKVFIRKTLNFRGRAHRRHGSETKTGCRLGETFFHLFLAEGEIDYFTIASEMCKFLLPQPTRNDRLLFMALISSSLEVLQRNGYIDMSIQVREKTHETRPSFEVFNVDQGETKGYFSSNGTQFGSASYHEERVSNGYHSSHEEKISNGYHSNIVSEHSSHLSPYQENPLFAQQIGGSVLVRSSSSEESITQVSTVQENLVRSNSVQQSLVEASVVEGEVVVEDPVLKGFVVEDPVGKGFVVEDPVLKGFVVDGEAVVG